jgi:hypothetical protein
MIRSRKDAQEFVARVREFSLPNHHNSAIREFRISGDRYVSRSLNRPAHIVVRILPDGTWQSMAAGPGWQEQGWTTIFDPAGWVYAHRAGVNEYLRTWERTQGRPWEA